MPIIMHKKYPRDNKTCRPKTMGQGEMGWITGKLHVFIHWRYADRQPQLLGDRKNPFVILQFSSSTTIRPSLYLVSNRRYHYCHITIIRIITISAALATILECYYCNNNNKRILLLPEPLFSCATTNGLWIWRETVPHRKLSTLPAL